MERTGPAKHGSITAIYTVLVDGEDMDEPIADLARATLDGHIIRAIQATTSGLAAQRARMDVVSSNVANVDTTRAADGEGPYKRQVVRFAATDGATPFANIMQRMSNTPSNGVIVTQVMEDNTTPSRFVTDPSNPDANEEGLVEMPNVNLISEMTDLTSANRSYQANVTVLNAIKEMALRALDIGNR